MMTIAFTFDCYTACSVLTILCSMIASDKKKLHEFKLNGGFSSVLTLLDVGGIRFFFSNERFYNQDALACTTFIKKSRY